MFFHGEIRCLGDLDRLKAILDGNRNFSPVLDRFDEFADFISEGLHVAFEEEEQRLVFCDGFFGADGYVGFRIVRPLAVPSEEEAKLFEPDPDVWAKYKVLNPR